MLYFDVEADWKKFRDLQREIVRLKESLQDISLDESQIEENTKQLEKMQAALVDMAKAAAVAGVDIERGFAHKVQATRASLQEYGEMIDSTKEKIQRYTENVARLKEMQSKYASNSNNFKEIGVNIDRETAALEREKNNLDTLTEQRRLAIKSLSQMSLEYDIARDKADDFTDALEIQSASLKQSMGTIKNIAAGVFSFGAAKGFIQKMADVRASFQDTESSMTIFLKDAQRATSFVEDLKKEAYFNMFEFSDLNQASTQMLSYGTSVDDVIPKLHQLSEIATGTHQPIGLMVDLFNKAKAVGTVDTRGLQQWARAGLNVADTLENAGMKVDRTKITFEQLNKAIEISTQAGGQFSGIMNSQMQNISAITGQLKDNITNMFNELGKQNEGTIHDAIQYVSELVANYDKLVPIVKDLAVAFGSFKAASYVLDIVQELSGKFETLSDVLTDNATKTELLTVRKKGLREGTEEYIKALQLEMEKSEIKADTMLKNADKELAKATELYDTKELALKQIDEEIKANDTLLESALKTGDTKQADVLQTRKNTLETNKNTISEELNAAAKDKNTAATKKKEAEQQKEALATRKNTIENERNAASQKFLQRAVNGVKGAFAKLKVALLSNPFTLIAAGVAALISVISKLRDKYNEIHEGETRAAAAMAKAADAANDEKIKLGNLKDALESTEKGTEKYNQKKKEVVSFAAQYDRTLAREIEQTGLSAENYNALAAAIERTANARRAADYVASEGQKIQEGRDTFITTTRERLAKYVSEGKGKNKGTTDADIEQRQKDVDAAMALVAEYYEKAVTNTSGKYVNFAGKTGSTNLDIIKAMGFDDTKATEIYKALHFIDDMGKGGDFSHALEEQLRKEQSSRKGIRTMMAAGGVDYTKLAETVVQQADTIIGRVVDENGKETLNDIVRQRESLAENKGYDKIQKMTDISNALNSNVELLKIKQQTLEQYAELAVGEDKEGVLKYINEVKRYIQEYEDAKAKAQEQIAASRDETVKEALARTKKEWEAAKKEVENIKNNGGKAADLSAAQQRESDAKKAYQALGGVTEDKEVERQQKFQDELAKMRQSNLQREINLQEEGLKKKIELIDLEYDKKIEEYKKRERDLDKQLANKEITQEEYDTSVQIIDKERDLAKQERDKSVDDVYAKLVDGYKDYTDKKREIDEKYNKDKAELEAVINSENATDEQKALAKKGLVKLEEGHNKAIVDLGMEKIKEGGQWRKVFENLNNYGITTLNNLKKELEDVGKDLTENMNPADLEAYNEALQRLRERLMDFDPMGSYKTAKENLKDKKQAAKDAKTRYEAAKGTEEEAKALQELVKAEDEAAEAQENFNTAQEKMLSHVDKMTAPLKKFASQLEELGSKSDTLAGDIAAAVGSVVNTTFDCIDQIVNITETASQAMEAAAKGAEGASKTTAAAISAVEKASIVLAIISAVLQIGQQIEQMIDKSKQRNEEKINDINRLQGAVNDYRNAVLEAQLAEKNWFSQTKRGGLEDSWKRSKQALDNYDKTANKIVEKYKDEEGGGPMVQIGKWATKATSAIGDTVGAGLKKMGADWADTALEYIDLGRLSSKAFDAANGEGWSWGESHQNIYQATKELKEGETLAKDNLRMITRHSQKGTLGIGSKKEKTQDLAEWTKENLGADLYNEATGRLDIDVAQTILDNYTEDLPKATKITLEELKKQEEAIEQFEEDVKSNVSDTFSSMADSLVDSLFNWLDTGEDVLDAFERDTKETFRNIAKDTLKQQLLEQYFNAYADDLAEVTTKGAQGTITPEEAAAEYKRIQDNLNRVIARDEAQLKGMVQAIDKVFGGTTAMAEQQSAVAKGFQTMSESKADVLEARFTAVYESNLAIQGAINNAATNINNQQKLLYNVADDARNILVQSNLELQAIRTAADSIERHCVVLMDYAYNTQQNTKKMAG